MSVISNVPRFSLFRKPTVLEKLERISDELGVEVYVKRDDAIEFAMGGNKVRKLEFIVGEAKAMGCDTLVTVGAVHSNHARTTAAAARKAGLNVHLVLWPKNYEVKGNLLLDMLYGAEITFVNSREEALEKLDFVAEEIRRKGAKPYVIPMGGAIPTGVLGYVEAAFEIAEQVEKMGVKPKYIIHASGSGGTQAGLILGSKLAKLNAKVIGIDIIGKPGLQQKILELARETAEKYGFKAIVGLEDVIVYDYSFGGYGVLSKKIIKIMFDVGRTEGLLLDPVYTAKAFAGLTDLVRKGVIERGSQVIFIHTGGYPIIFQYGEEVWELMREKK